MLIKRVFVTVLLFAICMTAFYISDNVFYNYYKDICQIKHERNAYGINPDNINKITFSARSSYTEREATLDILKDIPYIQGYGSMIKNIIEKIQYSAYEYADLIICDSQLYNMCNIKVTDTYLKEIQDNYLGYEPVLLGNNLKKYLNIGDTFNVMDNSGKYVECIVAGYLNKGAQWIKNKSNVMQYYNLDDCGLLLTNSFERYCQDKVVESSSPVYYICDSSVKDEVDNQILTAMSNMDIKGSISNEAEELEKLEKEISISTDKTFIAAVLLYVISVVSLCAVTIVECLINKKDYALLIICGVSRLDVYKLIILKNTLIAGLSGILSYCYCQLEIFKGLLPNPNNFLVEYEYFSARVAHCNYVPLILLSEIILMVVISCIVPISYLSKSKLIDIMK